jgi:alpha-tubulin suppressor-like RCC1 family protein
LTNAVAIGAGNKHGLALKPDGTVAAWGDNTSGQTAIPTGLTNVIAIADPLAACRT